MYGQVAAARRRDRSPQSAEEATRRNAQEGRPTAEDRRGLRAVAGQRCDLDRRASRAVPAVPPSRRHRAADDALSGPRHGGSVDMQCLVQDRQSWSAWSRPSAIVSIRFAASGCSGGEGRRRTPGSSKRRWTSPAGTRRIISASLWKRRKKRLCRGGQDPPRTAPMKAPLQASR